MINRLPLNDSVKLENVETRNMKLHERYVNIEQNKNKLPEWSNLATKQNMIDVLILFICSIYLPDTLKIFIFG